MTKKRFIAGAVCPACQQQDTLRWWLENDVEKVECVACQHTDTRLPKSVEDSKHVAGTAEAQVIGIFKPE